MINIKTIAISLFLFLLVIYPCLGDENRTTQSLELITSTTNDPIDMLVQKLNVDTHGLWVNGLYPDIELPEDAKPEEVIAQAFKMIGFDKGHIKTYQVSKIRRVNLNAHGWEKCSAAIIESDLGKKILLFKYEEKLRWWTRFYDVPDTK